MAAGANGPMKHVGLTGVERNRLKPRLKSTAESLSQRPTTERTPLRDKRTLDELDPPERSRSQKRRERELPVKIRDPAASLFLPAFGRKATSKAIAVMMIYVLVSMMHPIRVVRRVAGRKPAHSRESAQDVLLRVGAD